MLLYSLKNTVSLNGNILANTIKNPGIHNIKSNRPVNNPCLLPNGVLENLNPINQSIPAKKRVTKTFGL
jgi:hypothetical protein